MTNNYIIAASERQAPLEAAKAAFFASGGQILDMGGLKTAPRPVRKDVQVEHSQRVKPRRRSEQSIDSMAERQAHVARIREMALTMCYREAETATGLSRSALYRASVEGEFKFQPDPNFGRCGGVNDPNPERDRALRERLCALRDVGLSRRQACKRMGIAYVVMTRLIDQYGLEYPIKGAA